MKTYKHCGLFMIAACCILLVSFKQITQDALSAQDKMFLKKAAIGNMAEISAGQLALSQASSDSVKTFAQQMVNDHTGCLNELRAMADSLKVTLPTEPDNEHKMVSQSLANKQGAAFDRAYIMAQVKDHKEVIALFKKEASTTSNPRLKAFAQKYLPVVQMHLQMIPGKDMKRMHNMDGMRKDTAM